MPITTTGFKFPDNSSMVSGAFPVARYYKGSSQTLSNGSPPNRINFDTKDYDDNNTVTVGASWVFTAPLTGLYGFTISVHGNDVSWGAGTSCGGDIYKNGSSIIGGPVTVVPAIAWTPCYSYYVPVYIASGDTISYYHWQWSGGNLIVDSSRASGTWISINFLGSH